MRLLGESKLHDEGRASDADGRNRERLINGVIQTYTGEVHGELFFQRPHRYLENAPCVLPFTDRVRDLLQQIQALELRMQL
jgi:hypothetical protein